MLRAEIKLNALYTRAHEGENKGTVGVDECVDFRDRDDGSVVHTFV